MKEVLAVLQAGIILTTPVFFLATLLVLWRILRTADNSIAIALHVKRQIEVLGRGGLAEGVRASSKVVEAEQKQYHTQPGEQDEDHRR